MTLNRDRDTVLTSHFAYERTRSIASMATSRFQRGRENRRGVPTVPMYLEVRPEDKAILDRLAATTGARKNALFEEILRHVPVDAYGVPTWWDKPLPVDRELPLTG